MKNVVKILLNCFLVLGLFSCEKDRDEKINQELVGEYQVVFVEITPKLDINMDGVFSENFLDEMECYNEDKIVLEKDGTFNSESGFLNVNVESSNGNDLEFIVRCDQGISIALPATYRTEGNRVIVTVQDFEETYEFEFDVIDNTIVLERKIPEMLRVNEDGSFDFIQVDAIYTYKRQ